MANAFNFYGAKIYFLANCKRELISFENARHY